MLLATAIGLIGVAFTDWKLPTLADLPGLLALGILGFLAQLFMTKAFRTYEANMVAPIKYVEVLFTLSLGVFVFDESYTFLSLLGIALIIVGLVANIFYKSYSQKKLS